MVNVENNYLIKISPKFPVNWPSMYSSVFASYREIQILRNF